MNLRLSKNSMRFRVNHLEAQSLLQNAVLTDSLPFGSEDLTVSVHTTKQESICVVPFQVNRLEIFIPKEGLKRLLSKSDQKTGKTSLEMKDEALMGGRRVEIRFEIDRFSNRESFEMKPNKQGEIGND